MPYQLAQLNIAHLAAPIESPRLVDFVDNLDWINALADNSPGFIWRLQTEDGDATGIDHFGADVIANLSVWEGVEALHRYVYHTAHVEVLRRKKEWFNKVRDAHMVLWWIPAGHIPTLQEADARLQQFREHGATPEAFSFKQTFSPPDQPVIDDAPGFDDACPAG